MVSRAAEEAEKSGLSEIRGANRDANMSCYFVRIRVSPMQTDTLLAIGTTEYFPNYPGFASDWFLLGQDTDFRRADANPWRPDLVFGPVC